MWYFNMTRKKTANDDFCYHILAAQSARWAASADKLLAASEELGIEGQNLAQFPLARPERTMLAALMDLPHELRHKLLGNARNFSVVEAVSMVTAMSASFLAAKPELQRSMQGAAAKLLYSIHCDVLMPASSG